MTWISYGVAGALAAAVAAGPADGDGPLAAGAAQLAAANTAANPIPIVR